MKMSSMDILLHRYFDGDLTPEETEAFLNDVASNPALLERLEAEARLDMAIVDDAYTIEPPESIRAAVLDAVLVPQPIPATSYAWLRSAVAGVVMMATVVLPTSAPVLMDASATQTPLAEVVQESPLDVRTPVTTKSVRQQTNAQDVAIADTTQATREFAYSAPSSSFMRSLPAPTNVIEEGNTLDVVNGPAGIESSSPSYFSLVDGIGGVVSSNTVGVRISAEATERLSLFTEIGTIRNTLIVTQFQNNARQQTTQNSSDVFVAVGAAYSVPLNFLGDRSVSASAAVAMSQSGAFGLLDLSVDVVSLNGLILQAGARMSGAPGMQANVDPMVALRIRL